jgi:hypothetical protein
MAFVRAAAFHPASASIFTVSLPNPRSPRLVVSRFDRGDMTLSQEFLPAVDPAAGLTLAPGRTIDALYVTAATVHEGRLWALSAAHSTKIAIDLASSRIVAAHTIAGLRRPAGLAVRDHRFVVADEDGTVTTVPLPGTQDRP